MFRTIPVSIIRSFSPYIQQRYMSYWFVDSCPCCWKAVYKPVWHIPLLCVRWESPDDGQRNCPKHVEFHFKIKFEKFRASGWFYCRDISDVLVNILFTERPSADVNKRRGQYSGGCADEDAFKCNFNIAHFPRNCIIYLIPTCCTKFYNFIILYCM
jgi:hypothetical protein